jgi:hypothetical protein
MHCPWRSWWLKNRAPARDDLPARGAVGDNADKRYGKSLRTHAQLGGNWGGGVGAVKGAQERSMSWRVTTGVPTQHARDS